jgi:hypothetical protein
MSYDDIRISEQARIEERPHGLVMTIEVFAGYEVWVSVNEKPMNRRGGEAATWSEANVIVGAHLVNLARELAQRQSAQA